MWLLVVLLLVFAAFSLGVAGYVLISHLLLLHHAPEHRPRRLLRQMALEGVLSFTIQPLLLAFYLLGRRMGQGSGGVPIVFVHGYSQNRVDFLYLARALRGAPVGRMYGFNYSWLASVEASATRLGAFVARVLEETGAAHVDLVCHSLGGLVAITLASRPEGGAQIRRIVTLGSPHGGVAYRGPLIGGAAPSLRRGHGLDPLPALPVLSVYSRSDNVVFPATSSSLRGERAENHVLDDLGHLTILFSPRVASAIAAFLSRPDPC